MSTLTGAPTQPTRAQLMTDQIAWSLMVGHHIRLSDYHDTTELRTRLWAPVYRRVTGQESGREPYGHATLGEIIGAYSVESNTQLDGDQWGAYCSAPLGPQLLQHAATVAIIRRIGAMAPRYNHGCSHCIPLGRMRRQSSYAAGHLSRLDPEDKNREVDLYYCRRHFEAHSSPCIVVRLGHRPIQDMFQSSPRLDEEPHVIGGWELAARYGLAIIPSPSK